MSWSERAKLPATDQQRESLHRLFALMNSTPELVSQYSFDEAGDMIAIITNVLRELNLRNVPDEPACDILGTTNGDANN